jgi:hypothetical protein
MDPTKAQTSATFAHLKSQKANKVSRRRAERRGESARSREGTGSGVKSSGVEADEYSASGCAGGLGVQLVWDRGSETVFAAELWARAKWAAEGMKKETEGSKKDTDQR